MSTIGILGGGQLARMLALAAAPLGIRVKVLDPMADACAGHLAALRVGAFDDADALADFAAGVDALTFDFENVPAHSVRRLAHSIPVFPNPHALAVSQDRLAEKNLFSELGIPVAPFAPVVSRAELVRALDVIGLPSILKTRRLGYDGKGQFRLRERADVDAAWAVLGGQVESTGLIVEALVPFEREVSIIAVRGANGEMRTWPLTENWHVDGVLSASLAPVQIPCAVEQSAIAHVRTLAERLDYTGVLALELFLCNGRLLANEMAPRVHNSGHWTLDGAVTSQFVNHLRAGLGLPLGDTSARGHVAMLNWIGTLPDPLPVLACADAHWHDYGKSARTGRKIGHATICADTPQELAAKLQRLGRELNREAQVAPVAARCLQQESVVTVAESAVS